MTTVMEKHKALLDELGLEDVNAGACAGPDKWIADPNGIEIESLNPTTSEPIAKIIQATPATYETVMAQAHEAFLSWRTVPAPERGQRLACAWRIPIMSTNRPYFIDL